MKVRWRRRKVETSGLLVCDVCGGRTYDLASGCVPGEVVATRDRPPGEMVALCKGCILGALQALLR